MAWAMECLLCEKWCSRDLVLTHEHAIREHGVSPDELRSSRKVLDAATHHRWQLPDGRYWMRARECEGGE